MMRYRALACDYDGTIAEHGRVSEGTRAALAKVVASGRVLLLVTGRQMDDLARVFPALGTFTRIVAENGALVIDPSRNVVRRLADPPPRAFADALVRRGVAPVSVGEVVVATSTTYEARVRETIREVGLALDVSVNKDALMVLPAGVDKASGLRAALGELALPVEATVAVGDAENDLPFLDACGCAVAVANALPSVKARADWVTRGARGDGVAELVERLVRSDLEGVESRAWRRPTERT